MPTNSPVLSEWDEERRLAGRNFVCQLCSQRWNEADLVRQDRLYVCRLNCYEENGGTIDRTLERARASALAAALNTREMRPPEQSGWTDDRDINLISLITPRPVTLTRGGKNGTVVLTGVGFSDADEIVYGDGSINIVDEVITDTSITLTLQATLFTSIGTYTMFYNSTPFLACVNVH